MAQSSEILTWSTEHVKHPLCDGEATTNVDGGDECSGGSHGLLGVSGKVPPSHQQHPPYGCDARDGVGHGHERRVQGGYNAPHGVVTCKVQRS